MKVLKYLFGNVKNSPFTSMVGALILVIGVVYGFNNDISLEAIGGFIVVVAGLFFGKDPKVKK